LSHHNIAVQQENLAKNETDLLTGNSRWPWIWIAL